MYELKALRTFEHGGTVKRGQPFKVSTKKQADDLARKGLAEIVGEAPEETAGGAAFEANLLDRNAPEVIAWAGEVGDAEQLKAALAAERGGKNRKGVIEALEKALAA